MSADTFMQLGVGGTFAILIVKMVFDFVGKLRKNGDSDVNKLCGRIKVIDEIDKRQRDIKNVVYDTKRQVYDLHLWHSPDQDGEQTWKNKQMIEITKRLLEALENNTRVMAQLLPILQRLEKKLNE